MARYRLITIAVQFVNNRLEIDLLNLTKDSSELLKKLLMRKRTNGGLIKREKVFWVGLSRVSVSHDIIMREKLQGNWHYDVLDNDSCGSGKSGTVYKVISVLKIHNIGNGSELVANQKQKRVYKIQKNAAAGEYSLMLRCSHLRARVLFRGIPSYISMRQLPGVMFNDALNKERRSKPFSHLERYKISVGLLRALKKQIHGNMICHRDIKPDNIFYHAESGEINIFDLGISHLIGDTSDMRSRGNATFSPPEEFISVRTGNPVTIDEFRVSIGMMSQSTVKADILSMAEVIRLIWRDADPKFFIENATYEKLMKRRIHYNWQPNFKLFQGLGGVTDEEKSKIQTQLSHMIALNPADRPDLEACINFFDQAYLEYKLKKTPIQYRQSVINAHDLALSVAARLDEIERGHDVCLRLKQSCGALGFNSSLPLQDFIVMLNKKIKYKCNVLGFEATHAFSKSGIDTGLPLQHAIDVLAMKSSLQSLISIASEAVTMLEDSPYSIAEFIEVSGIGCLEGAQSKQDLENELQKIHHDFIANFDEIIQLYKEIESNGNNILLREMDYFFSQIQKERMTIDAVKTVSLHIQRKHQKLAFVDQVACQEAIKLNI